MQCRAWLRYEKERGIFQTVSAGMRIYFKGSDEVERQRLASDIERSKASLASFKTMEQDRITFFQQAEAQLQKVQEDFDGVQNQLGQLLKAPG